MFTTAPTNGAILSQMRNWLYKAIRHFKIITIWS